MIIVSFFADMSKSYILDSMARAEAMLDEKMRWIDGTKVKAGSPGLIYSPMLPGPSRGDNDVESAPLVQAKIDYHSLETTMKPTLVKPAAGTSSLPASLPSSTPGTPTPLNRPDLKNRVLLKHAPPKYCVKGRKFELNTLCRVFLGRTGTNIYMAFLSLYIFGALWAYTAVFAAALSARFPIPYGGEEKSADYSYVIYAMVFGCVVVPLSCMELHEQVVVQVCLSVCRFIMLFLMLGTGADCAAGLDSGGEEDGFDPAPLFRVEGLHKMLPVVVFATIYHHSIPGLSHPVANKKKLGGIFFSTTAFTGAAYCFIGLVLGRAFGKGIEQSSNLNWKDYGVGWDDGAWWAKAVSLYIVCFPALDVISAFPLNAITLGNNILSAFYGRKIHEVENNRCIRIQFRLLASIPPIILAILVRELGTITDYAGTTGFILTFTFPALLFLYSRKEAGKRHFALDTYYSSYASRPLLAYGICGFGVGMLLYVVVLEILGM